MGGGGDAASAALAPLPGWRAVDEVPYASDGSRDRVEQQQQQSTTVQRGASTWTTRLEHTCCVVHLQNVVRDGLNAAEVWNEPT